MSLITQCPRCHTAFKVVRDQLKVSEGWVRCGQCSEVFDSSSNLREWVPEPAHQSPASVASVEPLAEDRADDILDVFPSLGENPAEPIDFTPAGDVSAQTAPVTFLAESKNPVLQRPVWRLALWLLGLIALTALVAQWIYREVDWIASREPRSEPVLTWFCALSGCHVKPLKHIEALTVESSSFNKLRGESYRLNFVVKNTALTAVARPAIEITLTDSQDAPLFRRVLTLMELEPQTETLQAGEEWAQSLLVSLNDASGVTAGVTKHIAGYRLVAFYP